MRNNFEPRRFLTGGIDYNVPVGRGAGGITFTGANNGTSISSITPGTVVLGQDVNQAGAPGVLISNREIPLNGFSLTMSQIGSATNVGLILKVSSNANVQSQIIFTNATGLLSAGFRVDLTNNSLYLWARNTNSATGNVGIGSGALVNATNAGIDNVAIGSFALQANTAGTNSVAIGFNAAVTNTLGNALTAVGFQALQFSNASTGGNTAVGAVALQNLTLGNDNVAVGRGAGQNLSSTNDSTIVGTTSLTSNAAVGDFNVVVGAISINSNNAFGASNVVIGAQIANTTAVGASNIFIGSNINIAGASITNTSIIYAGGTGANSIALSNVFVLGNSTQNVLIGQSAAAFVDNGNRLQVSGKLNTAGVAPLTAGAGSWDFGNLVTAASAVSALHYLEVSVGGVLYKVCIN